MSAIDISGLTVRYGDVLALDDISLAVEPGRVTGLIGMNGSGKSTLFKIDHRARAAHRGAGAAGRSRPGIRSPPRA